MLIVNIFSLGCVFAPLTKNLQESLPVSGIDYPVESQAPTNQVLSFSALVLSTYSSPLSSIYR